MHKTLPEVDLIISPFGNDIGFPHRVADTSNWQISCKRVLIGVPYTRMEEEEMIRVTDRST